MENKEMNKMKKSYEMKPKLFCFPLFISGMYL